MRIVTLTAVVSCALPAVALADVWQDRVVYPEPGQETELTSSSKVLYLNDCLPGGCTVQVGNDSSITNTSSIPDTTATLDAYEHGPMHWDAVVQCVKETMAPFDIQVVTDDPGTASHYEVMVGGTATQLRAGLSAGGIAPFISCGAARNNVLVFVFANQTSTINYLCAAIAHEAGHAYGLSHSLDAKDPMTYMDLSARKHWQNSDFQCGTDAPQNCRCTGTTQNQFRYLQTTWGLAPGLAPPSVVLTAPRDGAWVKPNFPIRAMFTSPLATLGGAMTIDGGAFEMIDRNETLAYNAPELGAGDHTISISMTDFGDRTAMAQTTVKVMSACSATTKCPAGFHCLGGLCTPGAKEEGGFGATCSENGDCITGTCADDGSEKLCTAQCDPGNSCPDGFTCLDGANVCWPEEGGCSTGRSGPFGFVLVGLGFLAVVLRRRRH